MSTSDHPHSRPETVELAPGTTEAKHLVELIADGRLQVGHAWLAYCELVARHGRSSEACASFIRELARRAAAASVR